MKKTLMGMVVFTIMFASSVLFVTKVHEAWHEDKKPHTPPQPATSVSKLRLHQIDAIRHALVSPTYRKKFTLWNESTTNNLYVVTAQIRDSEATYVANLYPDMLSLRIHNSPTEEEATIVEDYDLDGIVDSGIVAGWKYQRHEFNRQNRSGMEHRQYYQRLYEHHTDQIANKLGL